MVGYVRFTALALIGFSYLVFRIKKKKEHQSTSIENDWSQYQKNADGLYPWEVDQDDSPQRIEKTATRYVNQARPRRGKW
ncbi:hypothetical protein BH747_02575 [Enterococcus villorum]|uniref:Uncharacterized protein n=1 Tax=Enterococcus villorum TaxID=112904 RepID=A0A1V8YF08_9ENTE|nr:hypothetical protein [Enterococcus villorum]OQO70906.1 hypothetical protein BH747_02575 [Enterococcus villorum]OQO74907.1 hypothetical protein BH744_06945 [Enterococcus villorum]